MNVLSLFDGISCGQVALNRVGIKYNNYYASEIDPDAITITQKNFPDTIQIGDVTKVDLKKLPKIDLVLAGSPCQGFSNAGQRLAFSDDRSKLFFEFVKILNTIKPRYFLLENVKMKHEYIKRIDGILGVEGVLINSNKFSAQHRERMYWTNIPIAELPAGFSGNKFNRHLFRLPHGYMKSEIRMYDFHPTLCAQSPGSKHRIILDIENIHKYSEKEIRTNSEISRVTTPEECEELQTLPIGYTNSVPKTKRYKAIGNGWTVDVICHILKGITNGYQQ